MGLFNLRRGPSHPLPALELHLSSPEDKVYRPNDHIEGHVVISTPTSMLAQAVEISLWGLSSVWLRVHHGVGPATASNHKSYYRHYRDNVPLFEVRYNLLTAQQQLLPGQQYSFPFQIRVPEGTSSHRIGGYDNDADSNWTVHPHPLPPTFSFGKSAYEPDNASIDYGIFARVVPSDVVPEKLKEHLSAHAEILFQPLEPNPHPNGTTELLRYPKSYSLASSSLTGRNPASIGFRQKISDRFSSETPTMEFEVGLELPEVLNSGHEFKFRTTFNVVSKSESVTHIPLLEFRVLRLELLHATIIRAPYDELAHGAGGHYIFGGDPKEPTGLYSGREHFIYRGDKTTLNAVPELRVIELDEVPLEGEKKSITQIGSAQALFSSRIPGFTTPSFMSFAISRSYILKARIALQIGEKKFEVEAESPVKSLGSGP